MVLVPAVQPDQRVEHEQAGCELCHGLVQAPPIAREVEAEAGRGDDMERDVVEAEPPGGDPSFAPTANLAQLMRSITFPNSNVIFNVQIKDPGAQPRPQPGATPFDYVEWDRLSIRDYPGWQAIDLAALALVESTPLFLVSWRRCENGRPGPVDRADWQQYTEALVEGGRAVYRASQSRSVDAVIQVADQLNDACANCHKVYRDAGAEGSGLGTDRCRQNS